MIRQRVVSVVILVLTTTLYAQTPQEQDKPATTQPCSETVGIQGHGKAVQLNAVKRIFVDNFGEDMISKEIQSMIVSSLASSKRFVVTEDRRRADAVLKGVALEKTSQEVHAFGEGTAVSAAGGGHSASITGSNGSVSGSSSGGFISRAMGINDSSLNTETIDHARVAVRLVNSDEDVIWTTTQESKGGKYQGASADVADMCVKQLLRDIAKLDVATDPGVGTTAITAATK